jgi:hypothetical protein
VISIVIREGATHDALNLDIHWNVSRHVSTVCAQPDTVLVDHRDTQLSCCKPILKAGPIVRGPVGASARFCQRGRRPHLRNHRQHGEGALLPQVDTLHLL